MDTLNVQIFVQAALGGSLSEAARRLGLSPAVASRRLAALEEEAGARLAHRTTRSFALTSDGEAFLPHAVAVLEAERQARASVGGLETPEGLLRVGAPLPLAQRVLNPVLAELLTAHPALRVDLQLTDAYVDVIGSGLDVVLRVVRLNDSALIGRRLAPSPRILCAAPGYLARRGRPASVSELSGHDCLVLSGADHWDFQDGGRIRQVRVNGRLRSNSHISLRAACQQGLGIALYSLWDAEEALAAGHLEWLALDLEPVSDLSIWALYPSRAHLPARVRVLIEAVARAVQRDGG